MQPVLIARSQNGNDAGYILALMALVVWVFRDLGVTDACRAASEPFTIMPCTGRHGQGLRRYDIDTLLSADGNYRGLSRGSLLDVLRPGGAPQLR